MSQLAAQSEQIVAHCGEQAPVLAESLNRCIDAQWTLRVGEPTLWEPAGLPPELAGPGLLVHLNIGGEAVLIAIPVSLPLPEWYTHPDDNQRGRLDTLPMEWAFIALPPELNVDDYGCEAVPHLAEVVAGRVGDFATLVPWHVETAPCNLWMVFPANIPAPASSAAPAATAPIEPRQAPQPSPTSSAIPTILAPSPPAPPERRRPVQHLLKMPVPIIVKLAEKRISLGQLLSICPGAIITFDKSCEELLELCVNNQVYCRGEAVKIGEKFGLKINEVRSATAHDPPLTSRKGR